MDFGNHFPALRPTLLIRNPSLSGLNRSMNALNKVVPMVRGNVIDHLEQITVEHNDHLVVEESDGPSASQIAVLKAEVHSLRLELDSQRGKDRGPAVTDGNAQPLWSEVVTQQRISPRMQFSYHPPQIKEAKVVVCPPPEVIDAGVARWRKSVVGYFLDKKLPFIAVQTIAFRIWKKFGIKKVMANAQGFYFFEFSQEDVYKKLVEAGPWHFGEKLLVLKQWSPQMKFEKEQFTKVPVWVQFHQVPLEMWNEEGLSYIASAVGVPLFADSPTENCQRLSYARLCIEVDVGVDLPDTVDVEYANGCQVTVGVKYQWKPAKCLNCHVFGHSEAQCSAVVQVPKQEWVVKTAVEQKGVVTDSGSVNVQDEGVKEWAVKDALEQKGVVPDTSEAPLNSGEVSPITLAPNKASSSKGLGARSSNSFSALALDDDMELGNGALVMDEEVPVAPSPIVDTIVPPAKNTRGRGKGIVEAKVRLENVDLVVKHCFPSQWSSFHNASTGSVARIIVAWNPQVLQVDLVFSSSQLIVVKVLPEDQKLFYVSYVYGQNNMMQRRRLWDNMRVLLPIIGDAPWIQLGDFNVVRKMTERLVGFDANAAMEFNACLDTIGMDDMPFKGLWFTWSNKRGGGGDIKSKLDRVLINASWLDMFPESETTFLAPGISDHSFVLLSILPGISRKTPFKFFSFWMKHAEFKEELQKSWCMPIAGPRWSRLYGKLARLKPILRAFNKKFYSQIGEKVQQAREEISHVQGRPREDNTALKQDI
ncbi:hypothetical protein RHMOL_Rhmol12G0097800 [Rhododendron molle]|uniref:Uncharacterized protein n=1 Tax=Rhododendron molle TaxID=49168 RepID=A0ACC0LG91_RHOML|nr:hypothetical protein RHMOL_Rhmol12G0097800 [Rhododendron molle]